MACYSYRVTNTGTVKAWGKYIKSSVQEERLFNCPPGTFIDLQDVDEGSIEFKDRSYANVTVTKLYPCPSVQVPSACSLVINEVITVNNTDAGFDPNGSATIVINEEVADHEFSLDGVYWQDSNIFTKLGGIRKGYTGGSGILNPDGSVVINEPIPYTAYVRKKIDHTCRAEQDFIVRRTVTFLFATSEVLRNTTIIGGADGEVRIKVTSGSGNYTVVFSHEATVYNLDSGAEFQSMVKDGLPAGDYTALVTDIANGQTNNLSFKIVDPQARPILPGSFVDVPFMNSIHFVREQLDQPQTPDNRLLINQYYPGYKKTNWFLPVELGDFITTQINTDYPHARCELWNYDTKKFVKLFPEPVIREKNIGKTVDYDIRIENHSVPGQSRVYFSVGSAPLPVTIETNFEILNSAEGFNGIYKPVDIAIDPNRGYEYMVINKPWTPVDVTFVAALGRFESVTDNFDVMEFIHTFEDVPKGCYFMVLTGYDQQSTDIWISEPIDLQPKHKKMNIVESSNVDNAFGLTFAYGYSIHLRIPSIIGPIRRPISERSTSRNSDWSLVKISGKKSRGLEFRTYMLPPYMHEKLNVLFDTDHFKINKVSYQSNEDYADPNYVDRVLLANSSIKVEQTNWFDTFNSDDIGTVAEEGGKIQSNGGGFITR